MRRVFVGTAGWVRGGRFDRSRVRWEPLLDGLERLGLVGTSWGDCWGDSIIASFGFFLVVVVVVRKVEERLADWLVGWMEILGLKEMTDCRCFIRSADRRSGTETPPARTKASVVCAVPTAWGR